MHKRYNLIIIIIIKQGRTSCKLKFCSNLTVLRKTKKENSKMVEKLIKTFYETFGEGGDVRTYFAPGRVNLIGEHTDYNGGHVFPCALTLGTYGIVRDREDRMLRLYSVNIDSVGVVEVSLDEIAATKEAAWTNYPKGVVWAFEKRGFKLTHGMDILIYGDIPNGSGLSSSASLEVLTGVILKDTFGFAVSMVDIALIGQDAENNFNGLSCGIMDQFASAMGKKDNAIFLDTNTLNYSYAPVKLPDAKIVITNSKVKHSLVNSAYNDRRSECETALKELQAVVDIKTLGDLTEEQFEEHKGAIKDEIRRKRAKHAVYENQRAINAVEALKANDIEKFGRLMNASHESLRYDYEVSCEEIDILVDLAQAMPGVIGSRITGGGFGGCTVSIVKNDAVDAFVKEIGKAYLEKVGHDAEFYVVDIGDGAGKLD